jgi:hypothetical protein
MSSLDQAMVINAVVLFAVLEADLGRRRKISAFRLVRPVLLAAVIVPLYLTALATHGTDLTLEGAGVGAGLLLGLLSTTLIKVYRSPISGRTVSRAGLGYGALWTVVIGARAAFSYGSYHWFSGPLSTWMGHHKVSSDAITNALILMAVVMVLTRTVSMAARAARARRYVVVPIASARPVSPRYALEPEGPLSVWDPAKARRVATNQAHR